MREKLEKLLNHKQKRIQAVAAKLLESNNLRLSKAGEIEAAFKIDNILKGKLSINRVDYSSDHIVRY